MRIGLTYVGWGEGDAAVKEKVRTLIVLVLVAAGCWVFLLAQGGSSWDTTSGLNPREREMALRIRQIAVQSGGEWQNLTAEDRQFLVSDVSFGDETSARILLSAAAGKLREKRHPNGPPRPTNLLPRIFQ